MGKEPGVDVILAGGPDDKEAIEQIRAQLKPDSKVISTYGHTRNLRELVGLIDICDLMVCVDSAPMHLAVALGKPVVALFGPTNEAVLLPAGDDRFVALRKETLAETSVAGRRMASPQQGRTRKNKPPMLRLHASAGEFSLPWRASRSASRRNCRPVCFGSIEASWTPR